MFGGNIGLIILGMFVLVWIISAVVKATQRPVPPPARVNQRQRPSPEDQPDRATNNEIDRFMAELDRLKQRSNPSTKPKGQQGQQGQRPNKPRPQTQKSRTVAPPPLPPVLPVLQELPTAPPPSAGSTSPVTTAPPPPPVARTAKVARTARAATTAAAVTSPVLLSLQALLKSKQGPATAVILGEIFGERRGAKPFSGPRPQG